MAYRKRRGVALEILNVTFSSYGLLNRQVPVYFAPSGSLKQAGTFLRKARENRSRRDRRREALERDRNKNIR